MGQTPVEKKGRSWIGGGRPLRRCDAVKREGCAGRGSLRKCQSSWRPDSRRPVLSGRGSGLSVAVSPWLSGEGHGDYLGVTMLIPFPFPSSVFSSRFPSIWWHPCPHHLPTLLLSNNTSEFCSLEGEVTQDAVVALPALPTFSLLLTNFQMSPTQ